MPKLTLFRQEVSTETRHETAEKILTNHKLERLYGITLIIGFLLILIAALLYKEP